MSELGTTHQSKSVDPFAAITHSLIEQLFPQPRPFSVRLWEGTELHGLGNSWLVLNHPAALRRMLTPPIELSLGEAFIRDDFELEGDIFAIFPALDNLADRTFSPIDLGRLMRKVRSLPTPSSGVQAGRGPARLRGQAHSRQRDRAAIQYHYDVGNDFYGLWLDHSMQYSCAYFNSEDEELDTAQARKLDYICRKLRLQPGERLLDIGCGWGGLALYAAQHYGVSVLGITLSEQQVTFANHRLMQSDLGDRISFQLRDYRELEGELFDKVVSIGMFEHVGLKKLPAYFSCAYRYLKQGGLFLNHGIARRASWRLRQHAEQEQDSSRDMRPAGLSVWQRFVDRSILGSGSFIQNYVFPDGELIPVSQLNVVAEQAGFEVRDVENLREHYALTLRHWVERLEANKAAAIERVGEAAYRVWRLYMAASAYGFSSARINVNQTLLAKPEAGRSGLPLTRADLYR